MKNTGVMCTVIVPSHAPDTYRYVDMGNYFDHEGQQVLVTSSEMAEQYGHLVDVPIYVRHIKGDGEWPAIKHVGQLALTQSARA